MRISDWSSDVCSSDLLSGALYASAALLVAVALILGRWMPMPVVKVEDKEMSAQRKELSARLALTPRSGPRSEEHTSELQSLMRISYAVFCLKKKNAPTNKHTNKQCTSTTHIIPRIDTTL